MMGLSHNERLFHVFEYLKASGKISTYIAFGALIGENKAGVNDLKNGRKKATVEHFYRLKKSSPELNSDFLVGVSDQLLGHAADTDDSYSTTTHALPDDQQVVITALRETIASKNETIDALKALLETKR